MAIKLREIIHIAHVKMAFTTIAAASTLFIMHLIQLYNTKAYIDLATAVYKTIEPLSTPLGLLALYTALVSMHLSKYFAVKYSMIIEQRRQMEMVRLERRRRLLEMLGERPSWDYIDETTIVEDGEDKLGLIDRFTSWFGDEYRKYLSGGGDI